MKRTKAERKAARRAAHKCYEAWAAHYEWRALRAQRKAKEMRDMAWRYRPK